MPSVFEFNAKVILLCNRVPNKHLPDTAAFLSRVIHYEVYFSYQQKIEILKQILAGRDDVQQEEKELVMRIIEEQTSFATRNLNIRTLEKLISFVKYDSEKAPVLFQETTSVDEEEEVIAELIKADATIEEQTGIFFKLTGKSRRTFFRIKKRVLLKLKENPASAKVPNKSYDTKTGDAR
jgi:hypothetical protein